MNKFIVLFFFNMLLRAIIFQNDCHSPHRTSDSSYLISFDTETASLRQYTAKPGCPAVGLHGKLYRDVVLSWTKLNCERASFTNARMNAFTVTCRNTYVQFTFAQNMNKFMNDRSLNAFRHNISWTWTGRDWQNWLGGPALSLTAPWIPLRWCTRLWKPWAAVLAADS